MILSNLPTYGMVISLSSCAETVPFSRINLEISLVVSKSMEGAFCKKKRKIRLQDQKPEILYPISSTTLVDEEYKITISNNYGIYIQI